MHTTFVLKKKKNVSNLVDRNIKKGFQS